MRRLRVVLVVVLLAMGGGALAQDTYAELYQDVTLLLTVRKLDLSTEQIRYALQQAQALAAQRAELVQLRQSVWSENAEHFQAVNEAWLKGQRTPTRDKRAADSALEKVQRAEAKLREAEQEAVRALRASLSDRQQQMVESSSQAQERRERQTRMGGEKSVGEFVARKLDEVRDLMVDEYGLVAQGEALAIAEAIVGAGSASINQVASRVLEMMNQARAWSTEQYTATRPQLARMVEQFLGISAPDPDSFVTWDELQALLTADRSVAVLSELLQTAGGGEAQ